MCMMGYTGMSSISSTGRRGSSSDSEIRCASVIVRIGASLEARSGCLRVAIQFEVGPFLFTRYATPEEMKYGLRDERGTCRSSVDDVAGLSSYCTEFGNCVFVAVIVAIAAVSSSLAVVKVDEMDVGGKDGIAAG